MIGRAAAHAGDDRVTRFFEELKRRNVLRMAGLYLVGGWLIVRVSSTVLPAFDLPSWMLRAVIVILVIGFVPAMIFSRVFELTPEGLKREKHVDPGESIRPETGRKLDRAIMIALALALGYFAFDKFVLAPRRDAALVEQRTSEQIAEARKQGGENALARVHDSHANARTALDAAQAEPAESYRLYALALAHFALGNRAASDAALEKAARKYERDSSYNIAYVHAWRNEADPAFLWLDKTARSNDTGLTDLAVSPLFRPIHDDPRWAAYLAKVGYAPAQLAAIPFDVKGPGSTPPPTKAGSP